MGFALSGNDSASVNNRVFADLADANAVELTFPNATASIKTGKNGNSIFSQNTGGRQGEMKIRLIRGSSDDKFLNGLYAQQTLSFQTTVTMFGQFIKKIGDGNGGITSDTYNLSGGVFSKPVEARTNSDGDSEQSVAIHTILFANVVRSIS